MSDPAHSHGPRYPHHAYPIAFRHLNCTGCDKTPFHCSSVYATVQELEQYEMATEPADDSGRGEQCRDDIAGQTCPCNRNLCGVPPHLDPLTILQTHARNHIVLHHQSTKKYNPKHADTVEIIRARIVWNSGPPKFPGPYRSLIHHTDAVTPAHLNLMFHRAPSFVDYIEVEFKTGKLTELERHDSMLWGLTKLARKASRH
ncbi:hypothetical protein F5Y16DRAFT_94542 [Xylariaceae sp. FL0255]|nr:hypothetical protein F5Y16DRAFT_94542 [Xylariaceae sp. FL0255]